MATETIFPSSIWCTEKVGPLAEKTSEISRAEKILEIDTDGALYANKLLRRLPKIAIAEGDKQFMRAPIALRWRVFSMVAAASCGLSSRS